MDDEFKDLQRLLSIKRHETPPPEYFEDFLWEFQRRQRAELLKRPLWRLALDRWEGAWPNFSFARTAYRGAGAMAVAATVLVSGRVVMSPRTAEAPSVAVAPAKPAPALPETGGGITVASAAPKFVLYAGKRQFRLPEMNFDQPRTTTTVSYASNSRPRYVLDTQPASYEQPSSF